MSIQLTFHFTHSQSWLSTRQGNLRFAHHQCIVRARQWSLRVPDQSTGNRWWRPSAVLQLDGPDTAPAATCGTGKRRRGYRREETRVDVQQRRWIPRSNNHVSYFFNFVHEKFSPRDPTRKLTSHPVTFNFARWYRDGSPAPLQAIVNRGGSKDHQTTSTLTITPTKDDDGAKFKCVVFNRAMKDGEKYETTVTLSVNCKYLFLPIVVLIVTNARLERLRRRSTVHCVQLYV